MTKTQRGIVAAVIAMSALGGIGVGILVAPGPAYVPPPAVPAAVVQQFSTTDAPTVEPTSTTPPESHVTEPKQPAPVDAAPDTTVQPPAALPADTRTRTADWAPMPDVIGVTPEHPTYDPPPSPQNPPGVIEN